MILTLEILTVLLIAGLLVTLIFDGHITQGFLVKGFVYLLGVYWISCVITRWLTVDLKIIFLLIIGLILVCGIGVKFYSKVEQKITIKALISDGLTSTVCIIASLILFFAITYQHPETMVSLGSQWNTSELLSEIQQLFVQEGVMDSTYSLVSPYHGLFALIASFFTTSLTNGVPSVLQLFSVVYFSIALETMIWLARRLQFKLPEVITLLVGGLLLFNNVYDLYFPFVADIWLWIIVAVSFTKKDDSFFSLCWRVLAVIFGICFGQIGVLTTALSVLWQFMKIEEDKKDAIYQIIVIIFEAILIGLSINHQLQMVWALIIVVCLVVHVISIGRPNWKYIHSLMLITLAIASIVLVVLGLKIEAIENFAIVRTFLSSNTMPYEALILSCLILLIGIKDIFAKKRETLQLGVLIGCVGVATSVLSILSNSTSIQTSVVLSSLCLSPVTLSLVILYVSSLKKASVYLSGLVLSALFCSTVPWENPTYGDGEGGWEDFDHINRMPFAESEIYAALRQDMEANENKNDTYRIISQAPFTEAVFFEHEIVHSYLDYINTCQYCDVEALQLHEPSALFNIFVPRDYSDNRLFIESPQFSQTCALLNENDIDYVIYESDMNTDASMQWLSMKQLLSGCTTVIYENQHYILASVNQEVSK